MIPTMLRLSPDASQSLTPTVLIVEDEVGPRDSLRMILQPCCNTYAADNVETAIQLLRDQPIDLVTLDLKLPGKQGIELLRAMRRERHDAEVIIITGYGTLESATEGIHHRISGYLTKPFNVADVLTTVRHTLDKKHSIDGLKNALRDFGSLWDGQQSPARLVQTLSRLIETHDPDLFRHLNRTRLYAAMVADSLPIDQSDRTTLEMSAFLHDVGLIGIAHRAGVPATPPDGHHDDETFKGHPDIGARLASSLGFSEELVRTIRHHHEWHDGSGYPDGLQSRDIPIFSRIISIAQRFDHYVTGDSEHPGLSRAEARDRIHAEAGTHFDPFLVNLFIQAVA